MNARELIRHLERDMGFTLLRRAKGDHLIYQKGDIRVTVPEKRLKPGLVKAILCQARGTFAKNRKFEHRSRKLEIA
jgi:predicted RNA binding protein YcfA (HicA-like mRNA interferase family)